VQSSTHIITTNIQFSTGRMPFLSLNQQGKNITFHGLAYPKLNNNNNNEVAVIAVFEAGSVYASIVCRTDASSGDVKSWSSRQFSACISVASSTSH